MYGVVLAAGRGTRMRPLTDRRPKPLLPVGDRTLLEHVFDAALDVVDAFVVVVGYRGAAIRESIGDQYRDRPVHYVEQDSPQGTAHAILQARSLVDDRFIVMNGDVLVDPSLPQALAAADGVAIAATTVPDPQSYGVVSTDKNGALTEIVEKPTDPPTSLANVGCYAFDSAVFDELAATPESTRGEYEVTTTLDRLLDAGHDISVARYDGTWLDLGRPWELLTATETVLADLDHRSAGDVSPDAQFVGPVVVEEGARVRTGVVIEGPVIVRRGTEVGPNAYLRGPTVVGPDAHIGHAVEIKNSVVMANASVGHLSYVGDSVLGRGVNFGAGTNTANLRHDDASVRMTVKGERVDTGRRKLGAVIGDGAKTGIDTSLNPGVKLGVEVTTTLGEAVLRDRPSNDE